MPRQLMRTLVIAGMALFASVAAHAPAAVAADAAPGVTAASQDDGVVRTVKVGLNKSLVLDLPREARDILVSNPDIADAVIRTPRRIYVTGVKVGQSNVIVFDRAGQRIVSLELEVERDTSTLVRMLQRLIPGSNIDVEIVSDNIVLSGTVKNAADSQKAQDIASIFANGGAQAQPGNTSSSGGSGGSVQISLTGGSTPTSSVVNMLSIQGEDQVHLKITIAEVQRNIAKQLGVDFSGNISIGPFMSCVTAPSNCTTLGNPFGVANAPLGDNAIKLGLNVGDSTLAATIRALEQTGVMKTLAEPTLTAISGENASFLAGGEFPVPTGRDQNGNVSIEFKQFGVALAFTPVVLSEGRISLHVKTEVSELSSEGAISMGNISIPSLKVRRAESTLELPSGGAMVLGGLLEDSVRESISALPGLGKLPVLGALFRSRDFQRSETELVIIATPYLVKPVPRSALASPDQGFLAAGDSQAMFLGDINRVYGAPGDKSKAKGAYKGRYGFIFE